MERPLTAVRPDAYVNVSYPNGVWLPTPLGGITPRKVNIGCFDHAKVIAKLPNKSTQNQPDHSLCRSRWAYFQRLYLTPIQTRK